jgi:hypothetical protein
MFVFCRLKINHDFHEFILEIGTVTNRQNVPLLHHANTDRFLRSLWKAESAPVAVYLIIPRASRPPHYWKSGRAIYSTNNKQEWISPRAQGK